MKSTLYFLVEVEDDYNFFHGDFMVSNSIEDVESINRIGRIIDVPKGISKVSPGDFLLFHHNICRHTIHLKGKRKRSPFMVKDKVYFVPVPEAFLFKKEGRDWEAVSPYVFVTPIEPEQVEVAPGFFVTPDEYKDKQDLAGILVYNNFELEGEGVEVGDRVAFSEYSQHEYKLGDRLLYKMKTEDVLAVIDERT